MKTKFWIGHGSPQNARLQDGHLYTDCLALKTLPHCYVMQCRILIKYHYMYIVVWMLSLWLNMQNPQYCWCHSGLRSIIQAHDSGQIYHRDSQYHLLDPTNCHIARVHCIERTTQHSSTGWPKLLAYFTYSDTANKLNTEINHKLQNKEGEIWIYEVKFNYSYAHISLLIKKKRQYVPTSDLVSVSGLMASSCHLANVDSDQWDTKECMSVCWYRKSFHGKNKIVFKHNDLMVQCKTAVTPLLMHWSYCNLVLSYCSTL